MKLSVVLVYLFSHHIVNCIDVQERSTSRDGRKLFGGYKITPRYCKPTRETSKELDGPHICMFNHECTQRNGLVVGACMDGFLFGACCQLPSGSAGELMESGSMHVKTPENELYTKAPTYLDDITFSAVSHITSTLLQSSAIPTAQEDAVVQVNEQDQFSKTGVTHPSAPETFVVNQESNDINPDEFRPTAEDRKTTLQYEETTQSYSGDTSPVLQISISNTPPYFTTSPGFKKPVFRPRPQKPSDADKYILVPTINHETKPNKTQEIDSIVNIIQMLNESSTSGYTGGTHVYSVTTTRRPPTSSLYFTATSTKRPGYYDKYKSTTKNPSTYINTTPPRKTTAKNKVSTTRATQKPSKSSSKKPTTASQYLSSSTFRPTQSTYPSTLSSYYTSSKRPPSTSYVYSTTISKRPMTTTSTSSSGFTVTKNPSSPSAPTLIVLGPIPNQYTTPKPSTYSVTSSTSKRPVPVTINNYFTQNIYSTSERPSPTVLITPKPSAATSYRPTTLYDSPTIEIETSADDLINFPPVRNPNLNMSISILEGDITTPDFIEDDLLNKKVESFVNKIIEGLQEPFQGLRDVVYNKNTTNFLETTTKKPLKKQGTTKKPTRKPATTAASGKPTTKRTATSKKPASSTSKRPSSPSKRTKPTKPVKLTTTTESFIEPDDGSSETFNQDYRTQCGIRPLMKSGRIVGGKGATFGEFPWQVLVRESTWLGLFTKNKCGGVLISHQYVMTAAHCQPGFLASLVAVFGEFDISGDLETKRSISRNVKRVIVHRQYDAATFENDLALLELEHPIQFDAHIVPICLPRDHEDFTGRMATVTGWGRLKYGGGVPSVLQEVQVPIMENAVCQEMFRTAGHSKIILESFLCAGYANGQKDSCEGDSGGPLVLQRPDGRYQLAGTVSHGIKCAAPYLPGVYMRTTFYKPWIESITGVH